MAVWETVHTPSRLRVRWASSVEHEAQRACHCKHVEGFPHHRRADYVTERHRIRIAADRHDRQPQALYLRQSSHFRTVHTRHQKVITGVRRVVAWKCGRRLRRRVRQRRSINALSRTSSSVGRFPRSQSVSRGRLPLAGTSVAACRHLLDDRAYLWDWR
jgi:hypothetical protein